MSSKNTQISLFGPLSEKSDPGFEPDPALWPVAGDWADLVAAFFASADGIKLLAGLREQQSRGIEIYPANPLRALLVTPRSAVKVVILGQDPYPTAGHADGLSFSAAKGRPKSLARICEVLAADRPGWVAPTSSRLDTWAEQGVLLINTALTVSRGSAGSHLNIGWRSLAAQILQTLSSPSLNVRFMLWGAQAQAFADAAFEALPADSRPTPRQILRARHPSYDFHKQFMRDQSHFAATADAVDWWRWSGLPKSEN